MSARRRGFVSSLDPDYEAYLEHLAEDRAAQREDRLEEPLDAWGRDADWNYPRGYGGLG